MTLAECIAQFASRSYECDTVTEAVREWHFIAGEAMKRRAETLRAAAEEAWGLGCYDAEATVEQRESNIARARGLALAAARMERCAKEAYDKWLPF